MEMRDATTTAPSPGYATPYPGLVTTRQLGGSGGITVLRVVQSPGHYPDPPMPEHVLFMARGRSFRGSVDFGAGRIRAWFSDGDMLLAPAGAAADTEVLDPCEAIGIAFPAERISHLIGAEALHLSPLAAARFRDPFIAAMLEQLWREADSPDQRSALFGDAAAVALAVALLRHAEAGRRSTQGCGSLGPTRLAKVLALMRERLDEDLGLDTLAASVGLTPWHFARAFRAATGETPIARLRRLRVEHAAELIRARKAALAEIALACGFADQTHMTRAFRSVLGTTPGQLRVA